MIPIAHTGPTQNERTSERIASSTSSYRPTKPAISKKFSTAGLAVKVSGVDAAIDDGADEPFCVGDVGRQRPPVDRHAHDLGPHRLDGVAEAGRACAVELDGDAHAAHAPVREQVGDVVVAGARGRPGDVEPGRDERPVGLRAAGQQLRGGERGAQIVTELDGVGRFEPAAHAERRS